MFLNIITPCSRPQNLKIIEKSINIPKENYRWIIVFDSINLPDKKYLPNFAEFYYHKNYLSMFGNAQRNYALNKVEKGYIYFNDDDTIVHKNLWDNIYNIPEDIDFISFSQEHKDGSKRLSAGIVKKDHVDSHNFIFSYNILNDSRFILNQYAADGFFAEAVFAKCKNPLVIDKILSTYNYLR